MIYDMRYKQLIESSIKNGHVYETYIVFCFDNCIYDGVDTMRLEYVDGELVCIKTNEVKL